MHRVVRFGAMFRYPRGCRGPARRSAAPGGAHGVHTLRSVAPARGASDRSPVLLSHLPFPGSSAPIISSGDRPCVRKALCADLVSPTLLSDSRSRTFRRGSWGSLPAGSPCRASPRARTGRDCLGLQSSVRSSARPPTFDRWRCPRWLEDHRGPSAAGGPLPAPIRSWAFASDVTAC
jgi:hypothetical protein